MRGTKTACLLAELPAGKSPPCCGMTLNSTLVFEQVYAKGTVGQYTAGHL